MASSVAAQAPAPALLGAVHPLLREAEACLEEVNRIQVEVCLVEEDPVEVVRDYLEEDHQRHREDCSPLIRAANSSSHRPCLEEAQPSVDSKQQPVRTSHCLDQDLSPPRCLEGRLEEARPHPGYLEDHLHHPRGLHCLEAAVARRHREGPRLCSGQRVHLALQHLLHLLLALQVLQRQYLGANSQRQHPLLFLDHQVAHQPQPQYLVHLHLVLRTLHLGATRQLQLPLHLPLDLTLQHPHQVCLALQLHPLEEILCLDPQHQPHHYSDPLLHRRLPPLPRPHQDKDCSEAPAPPAPRCSGRRSPRWCPHLPGEEAACSAPARAPPAADCSGRPRRRWRSWTRPASTRRWTSSPTRSGQPSPPRSSSWAWSPPDPRPRSCASNIRINCYKPNTYYLFNIS